MFGMVRLPFRVCMNLHWRRSSWHCFLTYPQYSSSTYFSLPNGLWCHLRSNRWFGSFSIDSKDRKWLKRFCAGRYEWNWRYPFPAKATVHRSAHTGLSTERICFSHADALVVDERASTDVSSSSRLNLTTRRKCYIWYDWFDATKAGIQHPRLSIEAFGHSEC